MTVSADEFTKVGGLLNAAALWPRISRIALAAKFAAWLEDAETRITALSEATQDDGTRAWVTFRGWDDVYQVRLGNPSSVSVDGKGSSGYTQGQIDAAKAERDAAFAAFNALLAGQPTETDAVLVTPRGSYSTPIAFRF